MLRLFEKIVPLQCLFPRRPRWFLLRRRNLVAQAISNYMADQSRVFHSYQLDANSSAKIDAVPYDAEKVKNYIRNFIAEEHWFAARINSYRVSPINLFYEDIVASPKDAARTIANVMGVWLPDSYVNQEVANPIKKVSGSRNEEFELQFRAENSEFLEESLRTRLPLLAPATGI